MRAIKVIGPIAGLLIGGPASPHPGGLDSAGCHHDRKKGGYHCHRAPPPPPVRTPEPLSDGGAVYYPNCASARAAGAAPIRYGQPGYARHLDRDGDGVACE